MDDQERPGGGLVQVGWTLYYHEDEGTSRHFEMHERPGDDAIADARISGGDLVPLFIRPVVSGVAAEPESDPSGPETTGVHTPTVIIP